MAVQGSTSASTLVEVAGWQARIGRQGIYDRDGVLVAHELLFGGLWETSGVTGVTEVQTAPGHEARLSAADAATSQMITTTFGSFGISRLGCGLPLHFNMTRAFLVGDLPLPFGSDGIVLDIRPDVVADDEVLEGVRRLQSRGFQLALDDFVGEHSRLGLLELVDIVKVDLAHLPDSVGGVLEQCRRLAPRAVLHAKSVEHEGMLATCLDAGFALFQGYYFQRPVLLEAARMSPTQAVCLRLLQTLGDPEAEIEDIEDVVAADPGLSLVVLRGANSASAAQQNAVTSLKRAIVLLGPPTLKSWVTLTLLGGGLTAANRVNLMTVLARAECCRSVAMGVNSDAELSSTAYLAGMLSGIAQIMRADVGDLAVDAGVDEALVSALTIGTGTVGEIVEAVVAHECGHPFAVSHLEVSEADLARLYLSSWRTAVTHVGRVLGD